MSRTNGNATHSTSASSLSEREQRSLIIEYKHSAASYAADPRGSTASLLFFG
jgi:hypothetical protein